MPRFFLSLFLLALCAGLVAPSLPARSAQAGTMRHWYGRVAEVDDGDTFDAYVKGDGVDGPAHVRMAAVQAMELEDYYRDIGDCHARAAKRYLARLIEGKRVRLSAEHPDSNGRGRPLRFVAVYRNGAWRDVGQKLINRGHVVWFPKSEEPRHNLEYHRGAERAAARGVRLWNRTACGSGPRQRVPIRMSVRYDAAGNDYDNVNGEWIRIYNRHSSVSLPLRGWYIRDSALRRYTLPRSAVVRPGSSVTVHVGRGDNTATKFFWDQPDPVFENPTYNGSHMGDGAYLFDPDGDIRAHFTYPCVRDC